MVETDTSNANDQLAAAHQELRALALQLQEFLNWQGLPDWAPGGIAESRALESEANLSQIDKLLSRRIGIVGLEGAGKSTLINAMFGQSVVPTDADQPGTAIPIFVHATSNTSTAHAIETEEGAIRPCADYDELTSYVLQRHNADNHKQVRHASISLHAPHLPSGLCVVDLPGTAGMSSTLRKSSLASVESVDRVILVVQDRNAGPALELAHDVLSRGIEICAVAINLQMSKLVDPADLQPIPDDEARNHIAATRNHIERSFLNEFPQLQEKCKFFAFHFPSMHSLAISSSANHWLPSHVEEIFRFADWFIVSVSKRAALARLQQATQDFASKLTQLKNRVLTRRKQIDGLLHSDPSMQEQVCQTLPEYEKALRVEWARSYSDGAIRKAQLKAWDDFEPSARQLKSDLQQLQQTTKEALPDNWWLQNWQLKSEISESINRSLSGSSDRLNKDAMRVVQGYCDTVQKIALEALAAKFSRLPIDLGPLPMTSHTDVSIWEPPLIDPERQSLAEYDSARAIERFLDELAVAEIGITLIQGDQIYERFHAALSREVSNTEIELKRRYAALVKIIRGGPSPALEQARQNLSGQLAQLEIIASECTDLLDRLTSLELEEEEHVKCIQAARKQLSDRHDGNSGHISHSPARTQRSSLTSSQGTQIGDRYSIWHWLFQRLYGLLSHRKQ